MSHASKSYSYKEQAQKAYDYWFQYGTLGVIVRGWRWLVRKPERLTAISTLAIFVATAVAIGVGFAQWRALHNTDVKIGRQLDLIEIDQRPWVGMKEAESVIFGNKLEGKFILKNFGRSPALHWAAHFHPRLEILDNGAAMIEMLAGQDSGTMMPGQEFPISLSLPEVSDDQWRKIEGGNPVVYAFGRTDYTDNRGIRRCTRICMFYNPKVARFGFCADARANRIDQDCGTKK